MPRSSARIADFARRYPFLAPRNARRIFRAYGTRAERILGGARSAPIMGESFGALSEREVDYLIDEEWAETAEDILWRRSKLGLHLADGRTGSAARPYRRRWRSLAARYRREGSAMTFRILAIPEPVRAA